MSVVLSFFDYTGNAGRVWAEAGHTVVCFDNQHEATRTESVGKGKIVYRYADLSPKSVDWRDLFREYVDVDVSFIFGFPPCTDLAVSGALHFEAKRKEDPAFQAKATDMATLIAVFAELLGVPYCIENPVSVLSTTWRKPDYTYDPYEYGGYLPEDDVHPEWPEYIAPRDAYTKKTCLWTGGGVVLPPKKPVGPEILERTTKSGKKLKGSRQFMKLGGSSLKTKNIRNATPRGWAQAMYESNGEKV